MSKTNDVRHVTVSEDDSGLRLDRWLKKNVPEIPYGLAQKLIRKGQFRVDGKRAKADTKLEQGQDIRIPPVKDRPKAEKPKLSDEDAAFIRSLVIHDDGDVIALNKPYGLAVQGGSKQERHIDGMLDALINKKGVRPRLVHRLDKDTSGVLLLARSSAVAKSLSKQFKGRDIKKIYWAIVSPTPEAHDGTIRAPLIKAGGLNKERMRVDDKKGKPAITEYEVVEHAHTSAAFVAFWPRTGRTHQIRVHAELMGCPILGDRKYRGAPAEEGEIKGIEGLERSERLHLHAQRIVCSHPTRKGALDIKAPLPAELKKSWKAMGFNSNFKGELFENLK